jgi:hypothetical protein
MVVLREAVSYEQGTPVPQALTALTSSATPGAMRDLTEVSFFFLVV